jgi:hypothetical protein
MASIIPIALIVAFVVVLIMITVNEDKSAIINHDNFRQYDRTT